MASHDSTAPNGAAPPPAINTLTPASTITIPEKVALSNTTTAYEPGLNQTPRTSKDTTSNPFETDIEAMDMDVIDSKASTNRCRPNCRTDAHIWPGKDYWKQKAKSAKIKNRSCSPLAKMSRRNRIITKVLICILVLGIAVAVGFGVSKPLGARIWDGNND
ncbi:hypothetical protein ACRE_055970 [Hapsidospora chrysogenum ATCC 11550]|uniref:Uncharacterized protein n=1 Tax=Hapsidospora chrysogenum (strain ATCC 11550 / CBS 779.69 / DSM 880 / IAM 14645 / JCM 23072 / IMI 49137) TaxID=857340 RepID=A0A086T2V4_HAPC1|nr:hypothetical protein ACRE_055970 [Hapsidospora chrysogenum ATCC 11550]